MSQRSADVVSLHLPSPVTIAPLNAVRLSLYYRVKISSSSTDGLLLVLTLSVAWRWEHVWVAALKTNFAVYTHLALQNARKLMPCVDLPKYRSIFLLTITVKVSFIPWDPSDEESA